MPRDETTDHSPPAPSTAHPTTGLLSRRRAVLAGAGATALASLPSGPASATARDRARRRGTPLATYRWLGTAGWRVELGGQILLVDPYLTRFDTGLAAGSFDPRTPLRTDADATRTHTNGASTVLVTHTHWDHFSDVPFISREGGATVFGTETTCAAARACGVPEGRLASVKGGEVLELGSFVVGVVPSLHSRNARGAVLFPGTRSVISPTPVTIADLPEGDTLGYWLQDPSGHRTFVMGASDFVERELVGLAPDVAMVPVPSSGTTHAYVPRLLEALGRPRTIVPVHWDGFETPLVNPPRAMDGPTQDRLDRMVAAVRRVAPGSRVVMPRYLEPLDL